MRRDYHRVLFVFVDGIGLAPPSDANPFAATVSPFVERLLGGRLTRDREQQRGDLLLRAIDATLDMPGLPQSATGQTALFTGSNGAALLGRHATGLPGAELRRLIERRSIFRQAVEAGRTATFANAYTADYLAALSAGEARASVTTCAVSAAGLAWRTIADLEAGRAVTWDMERDYFGRPLGGRIRRQGPFLPPIDARQAGLQLARLAAEHDFTAYETFLPDLVGHGRLALPAAEVVRRLDRLIGGVVAERSAETTVVVSSDHGNFEDASVRTHSRAPVPLLAVGPAAGRLADIESILELAPRLLQLMGVASSWRDGA